MVMEQNWIYRRVPGFTLAELLVVIGILAVLMSLMGVVAVNARMKARVSNTKALIKRIHLALDEYKAVQGEYPSGDSVSGRVPDKNPATQSKEFYKGVDLDRTWLTNSGAGANFSKSDYDPLDNSYFVDAWRNRIRYRKLGADRMLVWSYGQNGKDEIGIGEIWDGDIDSGKYIAGKGGGKLERQGDDISSVDVDF